MSKFIYLYSKTAGIFNNDILKLEDIIAGLIPDNILSEPLFMVRVFDHAAYAISMPKQTFQAHHQENILLGNLFEEESDFQWHAPFGSYPDGNYAIIRCNQDYLEIVSDAAASRTIWYYLDEELFIASTSQRAVMMYLESFEFDERVIPWMLSTGKLGPEFSWDKRLKRLQADSSVVLDKKNWTVSVRQNQVEFREKKRSKKEHRKVLTDKIRQTIRSMHSVNLRSWVLPLSGGYDSRAILCFLLEQSQQPNDIRTVTWGLEDSIHEEKNDASIAMELAKTLGVRHQYYHTDISSEPIETVLDRFVRCGEGRIDHIAAYMDGMEIWRKFHEEGITGIIRGDVGFTKAKVSSEATIRLSVGCQLCSDYKNLNDINEKFRMSDQVLPEGFEKMDNETPEQYRDRLYHIYRLPTILAALSDIKFSYVEQMNPLLSRNILHIVRSLPDKLRTNKSLFRDIVNRAGPAIPYATKSANAQAGNILKREDLADLMRRELNSEQARQIFDPEFLILVIQGIKTDNQNGNPVSAFDVRKIMASLIPRQLKNWIRDKGVRTNLDGNILAFRVFMIIRIHKVIEGDLSFTKK